ELAVAAADTVRGRDAFLGVHGAVLGAVLQPRPHIGAEAARAPIARLEGDHEVPITLGRWVVEQAGLGDEVVDIPADLTEGDLEMARRIGGVEGEDRKSTRLNSSHVSTSYAVFCSKKKVNNRTVNS